MTLKEPIHRALSGGSYRTQHLRRYIAAGLLVSVAPVYVLAADWSISGRVNQSFRANSNLNLATDGTGETYLATTNWNGAISAETPNVAASLDTAGSFVTSGGPGPGREDLSVYDTIGGDITFTGQSSTLGFSGSLDFSDTRTTDSFANGDIITVDADRIVYNYGATYEKEINQNNRLAISVSGSDVTFSDTTSTGGLVESESRNASVTWTHFVNSRFDINAGVDYERYAPQNASDLTSNTFAISGGGSYAINPVYSISGAVGASIVASRALVTTGTVVDYQRATVAEPFYDVTLSRELITGTITLGASQSYSASAFGDIQLLSSVNAGLTHTINPETSFSADADYTVVTGSGERELISVNASLTRALSENWNGSVDYAFRMSRSSGESASSNALSLNFSRSFDIEHIAP